MVDRRTIDRAVERFRGGEAALYHEDGGRLYSDEEHEHQVEALLGEFDREMERVTAEADRTIEKAARTKEALLEAIAEALRAVTPKDAEGWFAHCGYDTGAQYL